MRQGAVRAWLDLPYGKTYLLFIQSLNLTGSALVSMGLRTAVICKGSSSLLPRKARCEALTKGIDVHRLAQHAIRKQLRARMQT